MSLGETYLSVSDRAGWSGKNRYSVKSRELWEEGVTSCLELSEKLQVHALWMGSG